MSDDCYMFLFKKKKRKKSLRKFSSSSSSRERELANFDKKRSRGKKKGGEVENQAMENSQSAGKRAPNSNSG